MGVTARVTVRDRSVFLAPLPRSFRSTARQDRQDVRAMNARLPSTVGLALVVLGGACSDMDGGGDDVPHSARKRVFQFRNGTLGQIRDSTDVRPAVDVADEDCTNGASHMD